MSKTKAPEVTINMAPNNRIYEIVATLLFCGSIGMVSYALAQNGWLEVGTTILTMFLFQLVRLLISTGLMVLPGAEGKVSEFESTTGFLRTASAEFRVWQARSPIWRLTALAGGYTAAFMLARWLIGMALLVFTNVWIAGAAAAFLAALIIFPQLLVNPMRKLRPEPKTPATDAVASSDDGDDRGQKGSGSTRME